MFYKKKPRVLLLIDKPNWAFDNCASGFIPYLEKDFDIQRVYVIDKPNLDDYRFDLLHVFFYAEDYYSDFNLRGAKIIKEISSHRWEDTPPYGPKTPEEVNTTYLHDAAGVICVSKTLNNLFNKINSYTYFVPNGFDSSKFYKKTNRTGSLKLGWAGNINDEVKGFKDIIEPALKGKYQIEIAPGNVDHSKMNDFFNSIDVLIVGSRNEGEPIPLFESMATGCFPVSTNVGIAPELIENYKNGIILENRTREDLLDSVDWCNKNLNYIRSMQEYNSRELLKTRNWELCSPYLKYVYKKTLELNK